MKQVRQMIKAQKNDKRRMVITFEEYQERLKLGLPLNNVVTIDELMLKVKDKSWRAFDWLES